MFEKNISALFHEVIGPDLLGYNQFIKRPVLKKPVQSFKSDTRGSLPRLVIRRGFFHSSQECPYRNNIQIVYTNFYSFIIAQNILKEDPVLSIKGSKSLSLILFEANQERM